MKVLVCGGRDYHNRARFTKIMDDLKERFSITLIIHGQCHLGGADLLAEQWAERRGIPQQAFPVRHEIDGPWPAAGPWRNTRMLREGKPDFIVAFPGGSGTRGMIDLAQRANIQVMEIDFIKVGKR